MELMQRLNSNLSEEIFNQFTESVKKYPTSCDNVWLAMLYGYPKIETHRKYAEFLLPFAEKLRAMGISVSMQLSNTIGHGEYMSSRDCTGLVFENSPARRLVGHDGTVANYCFCWHGDYFKNYLLKEVKCYAELIKPDCIWVDDDFRARNHAPVNFGCFCDDCILTFNKRFNASFTRASLVEEMLCGDIKWRERYIAFMREGLYNLMLDIAKAIHSVSPNTKMGLEHGHYGSYTGFGFDFIYKAMKEGTGHSPKSRPGAGSYDDHDPNTFIEKAISLNWQNATLPEYVNHKCPEIENLPFVAYGKSPSGTAFETTYYFANGNTDMTYSMLGTLSEPMSWHEKELALFAEHRPYWEKLSEINKKSYQAGMQLYISKEAYKRKAAQSDGFSELFNEHFDALTLWTRNGFPIAYDKKDDTAFVLHPACAAALTDDDIKYLLTKNVFTDGETIKLLSERGYDLGIEAIQQQGEIFTKTQEKATNCEINAGLKEWKASHFVAGKSESYYIVSKGAELKVLSYYENLLPLKPCTNNEAYPYGIADLILTTPTGAKWAVFGHCPWKGIISFKRQQQILNAVDYICKSGIAARLETAFPAALLPRKNEQGKTVCVSLANCTIGESGELKVRIRNSIGNCFSYMSQYNGNGKLDYIKDGNDYVVTVPNINPWSVLTIFID